MQNTTTDILKATHRKLFSSPFAVEKGADPSVHSHFRPVSLNENVCCIHSASGPSTNGVLFCLTFQATVHCAFSAYPITPDSLGGKYNVVHIGRVASPKIKTAPSHPTLVWGVRGGHKLNEYPEVKLQCTQKKQLLKSPLWKEKEDDTTQEGCWDQTQTTTATTVFFCLKKTCQAPKKKFGPLQNCFLFFEPFFNDKVSSPSVKWHLSHYGFACA